jgi:hypothetical protein
MKYTIRIMLTVFSILVVMPHSMLSQTPEDALVPFVGCESDGQVGPQAAPEGQAMKVQWDPATAKKMAYYKDAFSPGVLAPRGWHCFGAYGSSGSFLLVTPQPITRDDIFSDKRSEISGPGIQATLSSSDTSGRFDVARVIARVFPKEKAFVQRVINEKIVPASDFPFGPYPNDELVYKSDRIVAFHTPPNSEGLGTMSRLEKSSLPIEGVAILSSDKLSLFRLCVKLPPDETGLNSHIIRQFERENANK